MNIILVVFDTWRKDCAGVYGPTPWGEIHTPNFERFAEEALVMTRAYPDALPTLPARRAMYTGRRVYPYRDADFALKGHHSAPGWGPIPEDQDTMAELLSASQWRTGLIGDCTPMFLPSENYCRGFQQWTFLRSPRSGPRLSQAELDHWIPEEIQNRDRSNPTKGERRAVSLERNLIGMRDRTREEDYPPARVFKEAANWVEQNRDADKFFLTVESFDPHEPWIVPEHYRKMYLEDEGRENVASFYGDVSRVDPKLVARTRANYFGAVTMCDRWFGYFMDSLKGQGALDDTMIIVTSDHGHAIGDRVWMAEGERAYMTEIVGKWGYPSSPTVFDLPLMVRFPGGEHGGTRSDNFVQHHDIGAVILDAAGVEPESELDGIAFLEDAVSGGAGRRDHATSAWGSSVTVVNDRWWLSIRDDGSGPVLHDLTEVQPFESNVAGDNPDAVKELFGLAKADAKGEFPDWLVQLAREQQDLPRDAYIYA